MGVFLDRKMKVIHALPLCRFCGPRCGRAKGGAGTHSAGGGKHANTAVLDLGLAGPDDVADGAEEAAIDGPVSTLHTRGEGDVSRTRAWLQRGPCGGQGIVTHGALHNPRCFAAPHARPLNALKA